MTVYIATPLQNQTPWYPGRTYVLGAYFELTGTALASGDTIVFQDAITPSGIIAIDAMVRTSQLDSNATPLGKFELGDSNGDSYAAGRFITGGSMGSNVSGGIVVSFSNVAPTFVSGAQVNGVGYEYFTDENSATNEAGGYEDLVLTVTTSPATGATTGTVWMYLTYYCVGNP